MKIETSAEANILPMKVYTRFFLNKTIIEYYSHDAHLIACNGTQIPHYEITNLHYRYQGNWLNASFFIADTNEPEFLDLPLTNDMGIFTLH